jgi:hypothetical protein
MRTIIQTSIEPLLGAAGFDSLRDEPYGRLTRAFGPLWECHRLAAIRFCINTLSGSFA